MWASASVSEPAWSRHRHRQFRCPRPRQFRHPLVAPRVAALFEKHGLRYDVRPYWSCLGETLANMHAVGHSAGSKARDAKSKSKSA